MAGKSSRTFPVRIKIRIGLRTFHGAMTSFYLFYTNTLSLFGKEEFLLHDTRRRLFWGFLFVRFILSYFFCFCIISPQILLEGVHGGGICIISLFLSPVADTRNRLCYSGLAFESRRPHIEDYYTYNTESGWKPMEINFHPDHMYRVLRTCRVDVSISR